VLHFLDFAFWSVIFIVLHLIGLAFSVAPGRIYIRWFSLDSSLTLNSVYVVAH